MAVVLFAQEQLAMEYGQVFFGRNEVDMVGEYYEPVLCPVHGHIGLFGQQFDHQALVIGGQMLNYNETQT